MARRNYTQELRAKKNSGAYIVVSLAPHVGVPATYSPRNAHDPEPWDAGLAYRFSGRECHAVKRERVGQLDKDLALLNIQRLFDGAFQMGQDDYRFDFTTNQMITILADLVFEGLLERHGDSYVITRTGIAYLAHMNEDAA
jgi:hypothetical protein